MIKTYRGNVVWWAYAIWDRPYANRTNDCIPKDPYMHSGFRLAR